MLNGRARPNGKITDLSAFYDALVKALTDAHKKGEDEGQRWRSLSPALSSRLSQPVACIHFSPLGTFWWRCHRRIIADYLIIAGEEVFHILGPNRTDRAQLTSAAKLDLPEALIYPDDASASDGAKI